MMINTLQSPVFTPNLDPVAEHNSDDQGVERFTRAGKHKPSGSGKPNGNQGNQASQGSHGNHGSQGSQGKGKPGGGGSPSAGSTNGATNTNIVKPNPKSGQAVDSEGWPLNKSNQRVDVDGHAIDKQGRRINDKNQLINDKGQTINEKGQWINDKGQTLNTLGKAVNADNHLIDSENRLISSRGRLVDSEGRFVDKDGRIVDKEGYLVDKDTGAWVDKNNKPVDSRQKAIKGNNVDHPDLHGMTTSLTNKPSLGAIAPVPPTAQKTTTEGALKNAVKGDALLDKARWLPSKQELGQTFIKGIASGAGEALAALPVNVATSAVNTATTESIKQKYLPEPLASSTPAPGVKTAEAQKANEAEKQTQNKKIDDLQIYILGTLNTLIKLGYGELTTEVVPDRGWPSTALGRLDILEELLDHMEKNAAEVARFHGVAFHCAPRPELSPAAGEAGIDARIRQIEVRYTEIKKTQNRASDIIFDKDKKAKAAAASEGVSDDPAAAD